MTASLSILGHATTIHDPALAIITGSYIFAESVERHSQCKRGLNVRGFHYSWRAVRAALRAARVTFSRDVLVRTTWAKLVDMPAEMTPPPAIAAMFLAQEAAEAGYVQSLIDSVEGVYQDSGTLYSTTERKIEVTPTAHHLCHAANAVFTSPFDECVVMVADGVADSGWLSFYHYDGKDFRLLAQTTSVKWSLGLLYERITTLCGFNSREGEEWKVMGLAAYADRDQKIFDFFRSRARVKGLSVELDFSVTHDGWIRELSALTGPFRRPDEPGIVERSAPLAKNFQDFFEEVMVELAANAKKLGLSDNLAYSGGCALNSSCNGKLIEGSGFARLHVCSAPGDDGNALGAALYEHHHVRSSPRRREAMSPYLGSVIPESDVEQMFSFARRGGWVTTVAKSDAELCEIVASMLAEEKIIAWCQGRAEFGPRALGNRSIIADARSPTMRDAINARVKFREEYRPLAPSILHEQGPEYFENYQYSPYMERTLRFRSEVRTRVPAVVHLDGTGRVQSVTPELNPLYYQLIKTFNQKTGVPLLVNTSFNVMGKPIVHSAADAMTVFATTGLDALVIGRHIISKA